MSDGELQALRRQLELDPSNEELARSYERALLRGGFAAEVRKRFEKRFACEFSWAELGQDPRSPRVRYCNRCSRSVTLVRTEEELARYASDGQGVAGTRVLLNKLVDAALSALAQGKTTTAPDCFAIAGDEDLDAAENGSGHCACFRWDLGP